jgi:hypothetical protein
MEKEKRGKLPYNISFWLSGEMNRKLRFLALRNNMRLSDYIRFLLQREIDDFEQARDLGELK